MGLFGSRQLGWDQIRAQFEKESKMNMAGHVSMRDPQVFAFGDWGYVIGTEEGEGFTAEGKPTRLSFRATNVFVRKDDGLEMVHHHTDMGPALEEAANRGGTAGWYPCQSWPTKPCDGTPMQESPPLREHACSGFWL